MENSSSELLKIDVWYVCVFGGEASITLPSNSGLFDPLNADEI